MPKMAAKLVVQMLSVLSLLACVKEAEAACNGLAPRSTLRPNGILAANCASAKTTGAACVITAVAPGFCGGRVTCGVDGKYAVVAAEPQEPTYGASERATATFEHSLRPGLEASAAHAAAITAASPSVSTDIPVRVQLAAASTNFSPSSSPAQRHAGRTLSGTGTEPS